MNEEGVSHIAYFRTDGGSTKLYTQEYVDNLQTQLQQKENIIKEVREYIEENSNSDSFTTLTSGKITDIGYCIVAFEDILEILDKENSNEIKN